MGRGTAPDMAPDMAPDAGSATDTQVRALPGGVTVAEAAERAGISRAAARKRLRRGSWRAWKIDGEWRVDPASLDEEAGSPAAPDVAPPAGSSVAPDTGRVTGPDATLDGGRPTAPDAAPLLAALQDEVTYLRRKLDERDEEMRRQTITIAQLVSRLPQLQPPPVPAEAPPESEEAEEAQPQEAIAPEPPEQRPWWRRVWRLVAGD